jgi:hypothetical protein
LNEFQFVLSLNHPMCEPSPPLTEAEVEAAAHRSGTERRVR